MRLFKFIAMICALIFAGPLWADMHGDMMDSAEEMATDVGNMIEDMDMMGNEEEAESMDDEDKDHKSRDCEEDDAEEEDADEAAEYMMDAED